MDKETALNKRTTLTVAFAVVLSLLLATTAFAHDDELDDGAIDNAKATHGHDEHDQHGGTRGHIDVENYGIDLISKLKLSNVTEGKIADVGVFKDYAYLAAWGGVTCKTNGVHVVDIANVEQPQEVAFIKSKEGSYPGEGVQALHIDTPKFTGDILLTNNEKCNATTGFGGLNIYDVTTPTAPTELAVGYGDDASPGTGKKDAHEIHSVFGWDAGNEAYAVIVDNEEGKDVDIMDITDPAVPKLIAEYDLNVTFPKIIQSDLGAGSSFLHDMVVKQINGRFVMLLSYWDGGYVAMDVTNPRAPTYIADNDFTNPDPEAAESGLTVKPEGNAHQAEFSLNNDYIIAADEDFSPYSVIAKDGSGQAFDATMGIAIEPGSTLTGDVVFVGRGCDIDGMGAAAASGQIALIERGACPFTEKVGNATDAGYVAAVVFNSQAAAGGDCTGLVNMSVEGTIPALFVGRDTAFGFMGLTYDDAACRDADLATGAVPASMVGQVVERISVSSIFDGWGYVHLYRNGSGKLAELDTYAIPEAHDEAYASGFGDLSVHEVAMSQQLNNLGYLSYYAGGIRVVDIQQVKRRQTRLVEVGAFIDDGGNNFWGVETFQSGGKEYIAASDRDYGLYILEYTGPGGPN